MTNNEQEDASSSEFGAVLILLALALFYVVWSWAPIAIAVLGLPVAAVTRFFGWNKAASGVKIFTWFHIILIMIPMIAFTWPLSAYAVVAGVVAVVASGRRREFPRHWSASVYRVGETVSTGVGVGIFLTCVAQVLLDLYADSATDADEIFWVEEQVLHVRDELATALWTSPGTSVAILLVLLLLSGFWPRLHLVDRLLALRILGVRALLVLATLGSFTFTSSTTLAAFERVWRAERRKRDPYQELVAGVVLERWLPELDSPSSQRLGKILVAINGKECAREATMELAREVADKFLDNLGEARNPPLPKSTESTTESSRLDLRIPELPAPTLAGLLVWYEQSRDQASQYRSALIEQIRATVRGVLPSEMEPLVEAFTETLLQELGRKLHDRGVSDMTSARLWASKRPPRSWELNFRGIEGFAEESAERTAERMVERAQEQSRRVVEMARMEVRPGVTEAALASAAAEFGRGPRAPRNAGAATIRGVPRGVRRPAARRVVRLS